MMRPYFLLKFAVIFSLLLAGCHSMYNLGMAPTPKLVSINIIDRNGHTEIVTSSERLEQYEHINFLEPQPYQKVLRVYSRDPQGNIRAFITTYHANGVPKQYLEVANSRAYGTYKEWHQNGILRIEAYVVGGTADLVDGTEKTWSFDGECRVWNDRGEEEASFFYDKGELQGMATYYHLNGKPWKIIPYHKNKIEGTLKTFEEDGHLLQQLEYCNGLKNGTCIRYWEQDNIASEEIFEEGLLLSGQYFDKDGELITEVQGGNGFRAIFGRDKVCEMQEYRSGLLEGEVQVFNERGCLSSIFHIKNGFKHGEEICYYDHPTLQETPTPKISLSWYEGKIQGMVKTWYDNGTQESQKEMSNNKKNGHSTVWYADGSLMMIEEYDLDTLVKGEYYSRGEKLLISEVRNGSGIATLHDAEGTFLCKVNYDKGLPQVEQH